MIRYLYVIVALALAVVFYVTSTDSENAAENDAATLNLPDVPHRVTWDGSDGPNAEGPGSGKHIVFLAGDHEYRSEEILPAMARMMAWHHGFTSSVLFTLNDEGFIEPGSSNMQGLEILQDADLLVVGLRFQDFPEAEMQHFVDYIDRGGPVFGIRTSTHAFRGIEGQFERYNWNYEGEDYMLGFGRQVLGETWAGHYGTNHQQSSVLVMEEGQESHPIMAGVRGFEAAGLPGERPFAHAVSGGYWADPLAPYDVLARGVVLNGMDPNAEPDPEKERAPVVWTRSYTGADGTVGRVFTSTHGASEDFLDDGFRRMFINAAFWTAGMEAAIQADSDISLVGPYHPARYAFDGFRIGVKPADMAGWETPIMDPSKPVTEE